MILQIQMHVTRATQHHGCQHHVDKPSCFCFTMLSGSCLVLFWWAKLQVCSTIPLRDIWESRLNGSFKAQRWNLPTAARINKPKILLVWWSYYAFNRKNWSTSLSFLLFFFMFFRGSVFITSKFCFQLFLRRTQSKPIFFRKCAGSAPKEVPRTKA